MQCQTNSLSCPFSIGFKTAIQIHVILDICSIYILEVSSLCNRTLQEGYVDKVFDESPKSILMNMKTHTPVDLQKQIQANLNFIN